MVFPIATYGSESWTINAECQNRIEAFEMFSYRRMLRIPWTDRRTNRSIIEELRVAPKDRLISSIQRNILKYFGHTLRANGLEKLAIEGKVDGKRRRGRSPSRYIDQITNLTGCPLYQTIRLTEKREAWREITLNNAGSRRSEASNRLG